MRKLFFILLVPVLMFSCQTRTAEGKGEVNNLTGATADRAAEFADGKYVDIGRRHSTMFENGNIDGWAGMFTDDVVMQWSGGDSIVGKKAIIDYWTNRRDNVVESIAMDNDIWLPVKVNKSQSVGDVPGVWVLHWFQFTSKYKNGKTLTGWVHNDYHFNDDGKIDRLVQYIDRAPIQATEGRPVVGTP